MKLFGALLLCHACLGYKVAVDKQDPAAREVQLLNDRLFQDVSEPVEALNQEYGPHAELATALSMVLMNLTEFAGQIRETDLPPNENVTHHFGVDPHGDLTELYDKVQGFYHVLHEALGSSSSLCPMNAEAYIKGCINVAACLIQKDVPTYIPMEMFATLMEQVTRFDEILWGTIQQALALEEDDLIISDVEPDFHCDASDYPDADSGGLGLLQSNATDAKTAQRDTLSFNAALHRAGRATHRLLDSHGMNSSMEATVAQLEEVWEPVCKVLGCDHSNFFDIHLMSHKHTVALTQTHAVAQLRSHIRSRNRLEIRVQRFLSEHGGAFADRFYRHKVQEASLQSAHGYGDLGHQAVLRFVLPLMPSLNNETKVWRMVDNVKLAKFLEAFEAKDVALVETKQLSTFAWGRLRRWLGDVFECFGKFNVVGGVGYGKMFGSYVGGSFGLTTGASGDLKKMFTERKKPSADIGVAMGFVAGNVGPLWRAGVGVGGSVKCSRSGCKIGLAVGGVAAAVWDGSGSECCFGTKMGPLKCKKSGGTTFLATCCSFDFITGSTGCR